MTSSRLAALLALPVAFTIGLTGCSSSKSADSSTVSGGDTGSSSASADGNKAALCELNSQLDAATNNASTPADLLAAFKAHDAQFDQLLADAPSAIRADVQILVTGARKAEQANDVTPLQNDAAFAAAGQHLDAFCGVSSSSSSPSDAGSSPSDAGSSS